MQRNSVDLNSDMGEGFGVWTIGGGVDEAIMPQISSANIAAGFHAGDPCTIANTVAMAKKFGVGIGVHPGYRDLVGFGRRVIHALSEELVNDVVYQCGALREFARLHGADLSHVQAPWSTVYARGRRRDLRHGIRACAAYARRLSADLLHGE